MTPLQLTTLALYAAAAGAAVALARRDRRAWPVAAYLGATVVLDGCRWLRALLLPSAEGIRTGLDLWLRQAEVGLYLASILALPAMAVVLYLRRGYRELPIVAAAWVFLATWIAGSYPELRGAALLRIYDLVELGAVVAALGCAGSWPLCLTAGAATWQNDPRFFRLATGAPSTGEDGKGGMRAGRFGAPAVPRFVSPPHLAGLALIAGPASIACLPWLTSDTVLDGWPYIVAGNALTVGACLVLLLWGLLCVRRRPCTS